MSTESHYPHFPPLATVIVEYNQKFGAFYDRTRTIAGWLICWREVDGSHHLEQPYIYKFKNGDRSGCLPKHYFSENITWINIPNGRKCSVVLDAAVPVLDDEVKFRILLFYINLSLKGTEFTI